MSNEPSLNGRDYKACTMDATKTENCNSSDNDRRWWLANGGQSEGPYSKAYLTTNRSMGRIFMLLAAPAGAYVGAKAHRFIRDTIGGG